jgi:hypothetical protein
MMADPIGFPPATMPRAPVARRRRRRRWVISGISAGSLLASTGDVGAAAARLLHLRCTNATSGASWPITVDLDHSRVGSLSATVTDKWITWHDPQQGFFDLERATGKLQLRNASSTGGYFMHYTCRPE